MACFKTILFFYLVLFCISCKQPIFNSLAIQIARLAQEMTLEVEIEIPYSSLTERLVIQPLGSGTKPAQVVVAFVDESQYRQFTYDTQIDQLYSFDKRARNFSPVIMGTTSNVNNFLLNELLSGTLYYRERTAIDSYGELLGFFFFPGTTNSSLNKNLFLFYSSAIITLTGSGRASYYSFTTNLSDSAQTFAYDWSTGDLFIGQNNLTTLHYKFTLDNNNQPISLTPEPTPTTVRGDLQLVTFLLGTRKLLFSTDEKYLIFDQNGQDKESSFFHDGIMVFLREIVDGSSYYCQFAGIFLLETTTLIRIYSIPTENLSQLS